MGVRVRRRALKYGRNGKGEESFLSCPPVLTEREGEKNFLSILVREIVPPAAPPPHAAMLTGTFGEKRGRGVGWQERRGWDISLERGGGGENWKVFSVWAVTQ